MKRRVPHLLGVTFPVVVVFYVFWANSVPFDCCPPPPRPESVPRYPQGAPVTVYINTSTGFNSLEITAITTGITNWNNQNNSGVTFTVQETTAPPALPANDHVIIANYVDEVSSTSVAGVQTTSSGPNVYNTMTFIRIFV
jgi:hypothetical protein